MMATSSTCKSPWNGKDGQQHIVVGDIFRECDNGSQGGVTKGNTDPGKYNCRYCHKSLSRWQTLKTHLLKFHGIKLDSTYSDSENEGWQCHVCNRVLSREQRLLTHLQTVHGLEESYVHKQYKLYKADPDIPVPYSTRLRWNGKRKFVDSDDEDCSTSSLNCDVVEARYTQSSEEVSVVRINQNQDDGGLQCMGHSSDDLSVECDRNIHDDGAEKGKILIMLEDDDEECISASEHGDDSDFECIDPDDCGVDSDQDNPDIDSESDAENGQDSVCNMDESGIDEDGSGDEHFEGESVTYMSNIHETETPPLSPIDEKSLVVCAMQFKHRMTSLAVKDFLRLIPLLNESKGSIPTSKQVKDLMGDIPVKIYDVCANPKCGELFPSDSSYIRCAECSTLRFEGNERDQAKMRKKAFFATMPIEDQIRDILARPGVWEAVEEYRKSEGDVITDIKDGVMYKEVINKFSSDFVFTLCFNTDGAQLYSSSHVDLWPIFLVINELPPRLRFLRANMLTWGLWQSESKPNFRSFFAPFVGELSHLQCEGLKIEAGGSEFLCCVVPVVGIYDLQAKAPLMGTTHHNGKFGCITCLEEGKRVKSGKGTAQAYPPRQNPPPLRTSESFVNMAKAAAASGTSEFGIKSESPLLALQSFDVIKGTVPDYMHGVLLGVTKKLMSLWFAQKYKKSKFSLYRHLPDIEARLKNMTPNDYISRMPKKLKGRMLNMKASEYQAWLLYFSLPCVQGHLPAVFFNHYVLLVESIYVLLSDSITSEDLNRVEVNLLEFYKKFPKLYGMNNCGLNVHNVGVHLAWYARLWGPLWAWSCFPYEDMNGNLLSRVHGTGNVCAQALRVLHIQKVLSLKAMGITNKERREYVVEVVRNSRAPSKLKPVQGCSVVGGLHRCTDAVCSSNMLSQLACHVSCSRGSELNSKDFLLATRIFIKGHIFFGAKYLRMKKQKCNIVLLNTFPPSVASIQYFLLHKTSQTCYAVYEAVDIDQQQPHFDTGVSHMIRVKPASCSIQKIVPVSCIREKLLYVSCYDCICISRMPNLHGLTI